MLTRYIQIACLAALASTVAPLAAQTPNRPPAAPAREVTDEYFGTKIADPYRWMEEAPSAELAAWMRAQNEHARRSLDGSPARARFRARLAALSQDETSVTGVRRAGDFYFYYKLAPGDADRKLYVREGLRGAERLLVDPQKIDGAGERRHSLIAFAPSPDGRRVAYLVAAGGAEFGELRFRETATGRDLPDRIARTRWLAGAWLPDGAGVLYIAFPHNEETLPAVERYQKRTVRLHRLGDETAADRDVFGYGVDPNLELDPRLLPFPVVPFGARHVFVTVNTGVSPNSELYAAPVESLGEKRIPWRKVLSFEDAAKDFAVRGDDLYVLTSRDAPRGRVVKTSFARPDVGRAATVLDGGEAVTTALAAASDALYVQQKDGGLGRLVRVDYASARAEKVTLPYEGAISQLTTDPRGSGATFALESWIRPRAIFAFDAARRRIVDATLQPASRLDTSAFEAVEVKVRSHDGTLVPLSLIHQNGLKRDGRNPAGMTGYGAYGISQEPRFLLNFLPFLEAGGVVAIAHVRGGGEYGEEWHRAGYKATKPNSWKDFIACAEYLIRERYTAPDRLAGHGASAGGIVIGNAIAERPELFAAAVIMVGLNNMLRYETTANGVPNTAEFGSVKTEAGFRDLLAMDAYQKIRPGTKYPAVLLTHGINDPRVEPWFSAKMAARLQAATASGRPVLLSIDYDAGHGIGNSRRQQLDEFADVFTFLWQTLGGDGETGATKEDR